MVNTPDNKTSPYDRSYNAFIADGEDIVPREGIFDQMCLACQFQNVVSSLYLDLLLYTII
jgi:hypothetical protein